MCMAIWVKEIKKLKRFTCVADDQGVCVLLWLL
ncbi:hypothetical protein XF_0218 [Xylella fastidiosa 9a5c]|uniref:Uncharacterized protein n=1 Tax=Xylella fastidiosa (strain 9a5c) TaxID=160492 RepID=Q9PGT0_XYLFA|nr:hypothetical protein XF_0218 [Xylella fastidiosa 9a5c]